MLLYLDAVFFLNATVDFMLILGTNRLTGYPPEIRRAIGASVIGGIYGCLCLIPDLRFLGRLHWQVVFFTLMAVAAFGWDKSVWSRGAIFYLLSMALGGVASGAGVRDFVAICICAALVYALCRVGFRNQSIGQSFTPVELNWNGNTVRLMALKDTGNTLRDPLTGEGVLVCGADVGAELLGVPESAFGNPAELLISRALPGLRLIPYHTVGQPGSLMAALRLKNVKIGGNMRDSLVAFAPERIGSGKGYRMLTGGML